MTNELMRVDEVAEYSRVHRESVLRWIRAGRLRASKAGKEYRIEKRDLRDFMKVPRKPGRPPGKQKADSTSQRSRPKK